MRLPWNRSPQNLKELLAITSQAQPAKVLERVKEVFGKVVAETIIAMNLAIIDQDDLNQDTLAELNLLLISRFEDWDLLKESDVKSFIPDLVKAVHWKLRVKGYVYTSEATEILAREGMKFLPALESVLEGFLKDRQLTMRKLMVQNYIKSASDSEEVMVRTLRCLVTSLRHKERIRETIFIWNNNYQLGLKDYILEVYLYEQLALYTYLFKDEKRALFLEEIRISLGKYVKNLVSGRDRDMIVKDIVQDIFVAFLDKKELYAKSHKQFFIDTRLTYYFKKLERDKKIIHTYRNKNFENIDIQFLERDFAEEEENEFPEELIRILNHCLRSLKLNCQEIINKRRFGDYSETISLADVASMLNRPYKTLEKLSPICDGQLQDCVIGHSKQKGFRILI